MHIYIVAGLPLKNLIVITIKWICSKCLVFSGLW